MSTGDVMVFANGTSTLPWASTKAPAGFAVHTVTLGMGAGDALEVVTVIVDSGVGVSQGALAADVPKAMRQPAELVAEHGTFLPADDQVRYHRCLGGVWDKAVVDMVRSVVRSGESAKTRVDQIVNLIEEFELEPPPPVAPPPQVDRADIKVVTWMAVSPETVDG